MLSSDWTDRIGNGLLTLGADSIWSGPVGGSLIVGMIIELSIPALDGALATTSSVTPDQPPERPP
jgi:hypothetical protein